MLPSGLRLRATEQLLKTLPLAIKCFARVVVAAIDAACYLLLSVRSPALFAAFIDREVGAHVYAVAFIGVVACPHQTGGQDTFMH